VRRVLLMLATAIAVSALLFFTVTQFLKPAAEMMLGQDASPQAIADLNAAYGFDQPAMLQYLHWLGGALSGDLGRSYTTQQSVAAAIAERIPVRGACALVDRVGGDRRRGLQHHPGGAGHCAAFRHRGQPGRHHRAELHARRVADLRAFGRLNLLPSTGWVPWSDGISVHLQHMIMPVLTLSGYYFGLLDRVPGRNTQASCNVRSSAWHRPRDWASGPWRSVMRRRMPSCR
jgi:peptide/nickel transport system permease protein